MTEYKVMNNYADWIFSQLEAEKSRYRTDYRWGSMFVVSVTPGCSLPYIYERFLRHMKEFFPNEEIKTIEIMIKYKLETQKGVIFR